MEKRAQIIDLLRELEQALRQMDLWESRQFAPEELVSSMPFAVDILTFPQWLQFIFIGRITGLLERMLGLPAVSGMEAMAEDYCKEACLNGVAVISMLARLDRLLAEAR